MSLGYVVVNANDLKSYPHVLNEDRDFSSHF